MLALRVAGSDRQDSCSLSSTEGGSRELGRLNQSCRPDRTAAQVQGRGSEWTRREAGRSRDPTAVLGGSSEGISKGSIESKHQ